MACPIKPIDIFIYIFLLGGIFLFLFGLYGMIHTQFKSNQYISFTISGIVILVFVFGVDIYLGYKDKNHSSLLDTIPSTTQCLSV